MGRWGRVYIFIKRGISAESVLIKRMMLLLLLPHAVAQQLLLFFIICCCSVFFVGFVLSDVPVCVVLFLFKICLFSFRLRFL